MLLRSIHSCCPVAGLHQECLSLQGRHCILAHDLLDWEPGLDQHLADRLMLCCS